jgi:Bacterial Ig-like domain (group 3)
VSFFGPTINSWYNSNQVVSWSVIDNSNGHPGTGIAGFTQGWDSIPPETSFVATPGTGDSFYYGPEFANATSGCLDLTGGVSCEGGVSQGWHYAHVRAWNNMGQPSGDVTYGPVGYDTVPPSSTDKLSGTFNGSVFTTPVTVTLTASDASPGSGVSHIYWALGTNPFVAYSGPFKITTTGKHALHFYSSDFAGNSGTTKNVEVPIEAATTTTLTSGTNPSSYRQAVTFKAVVSGSFGATPTGSVTFKNGGVAIGSSTLSGGVATLSFAGLTVGSHSITATYSGSPKNLVSTSSALTQTVNKANTTTKLASSLNPSVHGQAVTFTATVTGAFGGSPAGTVTFRNGTSVMGTGTVNTSTHKATFTTSSLSTGTHSITAAYGGSTAYRTSTSAALSQKVNP